MRKWILIYLDALTCSRHTWLSMISTEAAALDLWFDACYPRAWKVACYAVDGRQDEELQASIARETTESELNDLRQVDPRDQMWGLCIRYPPKPSQNSIKFSLENGQVFEAVH